MKCAVHPEVDATGFCRNCGKPLCPECTRDVKGALYCETCVASAISAQMATPAVKPDVNPGAAAALGLIPGLGAVYNGHRPRGDLGRLACGWHHGRTWRSRGARMGRFRAISHLHGS
jgi:hypothetical protein